MTTIGINASFLRKPDSGIGQVTTNFIRTLAKKTAVKNPSILPDVEYILYLEEDIDLDLPANFEKRVFLPSYKRDDLIRKVIWEKYLLPQKARQDRCDIFFSLYQSATILKDLRHIMLVHDTVWKIFPEYLNNWRKKIYYALVDKAIQRANHILTVSRNSAEDIKKYYGAEDESITTAYIDCDPLYKQPVGEETIRQVRDKYNLAQDYIFYIGGFDARKNVDRIIEAYGILLKMDKNIPDLVLAGSFHPHLVPLVTDLPQKVEEATSAAGVPETKIKNIGFVPQAEVPALYHGARLFCYPSLYEGFGIPVLEAFNCGCPTITSGTSSLREIADKSCAMIIDPTSVEDMAAAMELALHDDAAANVMVERAKEQARQFSWDNFTNQVIKLFKSL